MPASHQLPTFTLTTPRLTLRRFTSADGDNLAVIHCDPLVMKYIDAPASRDTIEAKVLLAIAGEYAAIDSDDQLAQGLERLAIVDAEGGFVGAVSLRPPNSVGITPALADSVISASPVDPSNHSDPLNIADSASATTSPNPPPSSPELELGYRIVPQAWGRGYATEAARAAVDYAFTRLTTPSIVATTMAVNVGSWRVLENAGFRYRRTVFEEWDDPLPGSEEGDVVYGLTREEWEATREEWEATREEWEDDRRRSE